MKKIVAVLIALAVLVPFATAQGKNVRILTDVFGGKNDEEMALFQQALSKATGANVILEKPPANYAQVLVQKLGAGEVYDLVYFNQGSLYEFAAQGILTDLTSRVKVSKVYQDNVPQSELDFIAINGKYYAGFNKQEVFTLVNLNKAITDKAAVDLAKLATLDDYYGMFKKVKDYMETREGRKPFFPLFLYMGDLRGVEDFANAVGARKGVFIVGGRKTVPLVEARARPVWDWFARLYAEGIFDPTSFTAKTSDMRNKLWNTLENVAMVDWAAQTGLLNNNARVAGTYPGKVNLVGMPGVKGPDGKYHLEQGQASIWGIPSNAANPDGAWKVIEYFATKEGGILASAGLEGYDYTIKDGQFVYTENGIKHAKDHGAPVPISKNFSLASLGPANPGFLEALAVGKRADVVVETMGYANGALDLSSYNTIMSKWMADAFMGKVDSATAMKNAENELRAKKMID
jgi:putative aldouronate transport system substrate-binding protein